jgi:hypothetical protein
MELGEFPQQTGHEIGGGGNGHQAQVALGEAGAGHQGQLETLQRAQDVPAGGHQFLALVGELHPLAVLLHEGLAHGLGELLHLHGDAGLGQMQFLRRPRQGQMAGGGFENLELAEGQMQHGSL